MVGVIPTVTWEKIANLGWISSALRSTEPSASSKLFWTSGCCGACAGSAAETMVTDARSTAESIRAVSFFREFFIVNADVLS